MQLDVWDGVMDQPHRIGTYEVEKAREIAGLIRYYYTEWCGLPQAVADCDVFLSEPEARAA